MEQRLEDVEDAIVEYVRKTYRLEIHREVRDGSFYVMDAPTLLILLERAHKIGPLQDVKK